MDGRLWKLPLLRRSSPTQRGVFFGIGIALISGGPLIPLVSDFDQRLSEQFFETLAQIGATLLIAFAVEQAALIRALGIRDLAREAFAGFAVCLGAMGVVGSGVALGLSQDAGHLRGPWDAALCAFSFVSIGLLGMLVAIRPMLAYDEIRARHRNSDE